MPATKSGSTLTEIKNMLKAAANAASQVVKPKGQPVADEGAPLTPIGVAVDFFAHDPALANRRSMLTADEVIGLVSEALVRRGMPAERLNGVRWVWTPIRGSGPELYLIFPGLST